MLIPINIENTCYINGYSRYVLNNCLCWSILILSPHLRLGLLKGLFHVGVPIKILKALLHSSTLATWPTHLNLLDVIILTILGERCKQWFPHFGSFLLLIHIPLGPKFSPHENMIDTNFKLKFLRGWSLILTPPTVMKFLFYILGHTMKFLIVEPSPVHILIHLRPKYSPR